MNDLRYKLLVKQEKMNDNAMMLYVQYSSLINKTRFQPLAFLTEHQQ